MLIDATLTHALTSLSNPGGTTIMPFADGFINNFGERISRYGRGWINNKTQVTYNPFGNGSLSSVGGQLNNFGSGFLHSSGTRISQFGNGALNSCGQSMSPFGSGLRTNFSPLL